MPQLVIAAIPFIFGAGSTAAIFAASFVGQLVITAGVGLAASLLTPQPKTPKSGLSGRDENFRDPLADRPTVYGSVMVGGPIIYAQTTPSTGSTKNRYLHMIVPVAGHEITAFDEIYFDDDLLTLDGSGDVTAPAKYVGSARILTHLGSPSQTADATLISESEGQWTTDHKLSGVAYIYVRLKFDQDAFPNGRPTIKAVIRGKKIYDPRTTTTAYSNNAALCVLDYLKDSTFGFGAENTEINMDSFIAEANICDENVTLADSSTENRYELNGTVPSASTLRQALQDMLTASGGIVYYSSGRWNIKVAAYSTPTVTITDNDLRGPISVTTRHSRRDNFNTVKGVFVSPDDKWQATDYPAVIGSTFVTDDNNISSIFDLTLPFTTSSSMAQRIAKIALYKQRQQQTIELKCLLSAFKIEVGDTIMLTNTRYGFSSKPFEVVNYALAVEGSSDSPSLGVDLILRETSSAVYDWNAEEQTIERDNTNLPDYTDVTPPGITLSDELRTVNQDVVTVLLVDLVSTDEFASEFDVQFKKATDTNYTSAGRSTSNRFEILKVDDGISYNVQARTISVLGVRSAYVTATREIVGKTADPSDVTNFNININGQYASLSWTPITDLDLSHYVIRHSTSTSGATFSNAVDIVDKVSRPASTATVPALTGTYFIKAVDKLGNYSINATPILVPVGAVGDLNVVSTITESPSFTGTKSDTVVVGAGLRISQAATYSQSGTTVTVTATAHGIPDATAIYSDILTGTAVDGTYTITVVNANSFTYTAGTSLTTSGNVNISKLSGTYTFATTLGSSLDLSAVYTSRCYFSMSLSRIEFGAVFDSASGLFDAREGLFDGSGDFNDVNAYMEIRTTNTDPNASPTWSAWQKFINGDYTARAFQFRVQMTSEGYNITPEITSLVVVVDMPDRILSGKDLVSGAAAYTVTFSPAYKSLEGVAIVAQNMATGDYYAITSKSASGFTVTFKNAAGTNISRTFDYVARGYGKVV